GGRQRKSRKQGRKQFEANDSEDRLESRSAETGGGFFVFHVKIFQHRLDSPDDKRQPDAGKRHQDGELVVGDLNPRQCQNRSTDPAVRRVDRGERNSSHGRWQGKREIHHRVQDSPAREAVSNQNPSYYDAEERIDRSGQK